MEMTITREGQLLPTYVCLFARAPRESLLFGIGKSYTLMCIKIAVLIKILRSVGNIRAYVKNLKLS